MPFIIGDVLFKRIAHCVHQMIEVINGNVQLRAELVFVPCVVADLRQEVHASRMDDDLQVLYPLDTVLDAVLALCSGLDPQAQ